MSRRTIQDIDASLKAAFDDVANQEVPDKFIKLLAKLRIAEEQVAQEKKPSGNDG